MWGNNVNFNVLEGKVLTKIEGLENRSEIVYFHCNDGTKYKMHHYQDCCEQVEIEDVIGDIDNLIGVPITMAEEESETGVEDDWETNTWTFYKLATINGYVTIRWLGTSNGYYSESVDFEEI